MESVAIISRDISDRKERERELERQNERLDEFASVVSHDLQNPLRVAEGRLELAREDVESEHLDAIGNALSRMEHIIEDMLRLAREGRDIGSTDSVDLHEVIGAAWKLVSENSDKARMVVAEEHELGTIEADHDRFRQLLENILQNAVEHGDEGVVVTIGVVDDGFYIEDTGPGIAPDDREDVFDANYSTGEDGTGFGLSIVKQIVDAHGWNIHVTEGSEGGARFEITGVENERLVRRNPKLRLMGVSVRHK